MRNSEQKILNKLKKYAAVEAQPSMVAEQAASYGLENLYDNKLFVSRFIQEGVSIDFFESIKNLIPFKDNDWSKYLDLSLKSFQRYSQVKNFTFKPIHSEKIIELVEVMTFGMDVFGNKDSFEAWLDTTSIVFNNQKPADFLYDSYGKELVMAELNRIEHGIFT